MSFRRRRAVLFAMLIFLMTISYVSVKTSYITKRLSHLNYPTEKLIAERSPLSMSKYAHQNVAKDNVRVLQSGEYQSVKNLTTNGWVFKNSKLINATTNESVDVVLSKNPNNKEEYIMGVLSRWSVKDSLYSEISIFLINFTERGEIYINSTEFNVSVSYLGGFTVTGTTGNYLRITAFDLVWKNATTVAVVYIKQYVSQKQSVSEQTYVDTYNISTRSLNITTGVWTSEENIVSDVIGVGYDVSIFRWGNTDEATILWIGTRVVYYWGTVSAVRYEGQFIRESGKVADISFDKLNVSKATPDSAYISNIVWDPWGRDVCVVISLVSSIGSALASLIWDGVETSVSAEPIIATSDLDDYDLPLLDFKDPSIAPINNISDFIVSFIGYSDYDSYVMYFRGEFLGDSIGAPDDIVLENQLRSSSKTLLIDNNYLDNKSILAWIDRTGAAVVKAMIIEYNYSEQVFNKSEITTYANISDVVDFDALFMGSLNITMVVNSTYSPETEANNSILLAFAADVNGSRYPYVAFGLRDSDHDYLGDCEETFYSGDCRISDTDDDWILDGSEVFVYKTGVNNSDTDNDGLSDGMEVRGVDIPTVGIRSTNPLVNDTDSDKIMDGVEAKGVHINIPSNNISAVFYADPTVTDTDDDGLSDYDELFGGWQVYVRYFNKTTDTYTVYSNATNPDSDNDMFDDYQELMSNSDPWRSDTDKDGLTDVEEYYLGTRIYDADPDDDYLTDYNESMGVNITNPVTNKTYKVYTDPWDGDTDSDMLLDGEEVRGFNVPGIGFVQTDPTDPDIDSDGLTDYYEVNGITIPEGTCYSNPWDSDTDNDFLDDGAEWDWETNTTNPDTDGDSLLDGNETQGIYIVGIGIRQTDPRNNDTDGDTLSDYEEYLLHTDPTEEDSDYDGLNDSFELRGWDIVVVYPNGTKVSYHKAPSPVKSDTDGDRLDDLWEWYYHSDPWKNDTDGDGLIDSREDYIGTDPCDADSDDDNLTDYQEIIGFNITGVGYVYTDPLDPDTDGDSLSDYNECMKYETNPDEWDTDGDGLGDYDEVFGTVAGYSTDPKKVDTDADNISDWDEILVYSTNATLPDTDGDGLSDGKEIYGVNITGIGVRQTDPLSIDTDNDNLNDSYEILIGTDPTSKDTDRDNIDDGTELGLGTDPRKADTDGDGLSDGKELAVYSTEPLDSDTDDDGLSDYEEIGLSDPRTPDTDGDGLSDYEEIVIYNTDPKKVDTDGDGLWDSTEINGWNVTVIYSNLSRISYSVNSSPLKGDTDGDGLSDYYEYTYKSDPRINDTDKDGLSDWDEYTAGTMLTDVDSDDDGLLDSEEIEGVYVDEQIGTVKTNPLSNDTDNDGVPDYDEVYGVEIPGIGIRKTNPAKEDTDNDGISDGEEIYVRGTDPRSKDTDGDGLSDYREIYEIGTDPRSKDTDHDLIPDNMDILLPRFNDFIIVVIIIFVLGLFEAHVYGLFRNWRKDIVAFGLSDLGGIPLFVVPEDFKSEYDPGLISSGLLGIFTMTSEISGKELKQLVLSGAIPIFLNRGENTIVWVFIRKAYPRIIKQLSKLHEELEKVYGPLLAEWSGVAEEVEDVKLWVLSRLGMRIPREKALEEEAEVKVEEFDKLFGEE